MVAAVACWRTVLTSCVLLGVTPARPDARTRVVTPEPLGDCCACVDLIAATLLDFTAEADVKVDVEAAGLLGPAMDQGRLRGDAGPWKALRVGEEVRSEPFGQRLLLLVLLLVVDDSAGGLGFVLTTTEV